MLRKVEHAFLLGAVSGSGMGLLTELYQAEKSFLTKFFTKWETSLRLLSDITEGVDGVTVDSYCDTLVTGYSLLMLLLPYPFVLAFLFYFFSNRILMENFLILLFRKCIRYQQGPQLVSFSCSVSSYV